MNRPIIKNVDELRALCDPVIAYLKKNCDPYIEVRISMDDIKVISVECGIPVKR